MSPRAICKDNNSLWFSSPLENYCKFPSSKIRGVLTSLRTLPTPVVQTIQPDYLSSSEIVSLNIPS